MGQKPGKAALEHGEMDPFGSIDRAPEERGEHGRGEAEAGGARQSTKPRGLANPGRLIAEQEKIAFEQRELGHERRGASQTPKSRAKTGNVEDRGERERGADRDDAPPEKRGTGEPPERAFTPGRRNALRLEKRRRQSHDGEEGQGDEHSAPEKAETNPAENDEMERKESEGRK